MSKNTGTSELINYFDLGANGDVGIAGSLDINTIANATTDTDTFLVSDTGIIKYRTGAQLLSDIGGQAAGNYVTLDTIQTITARKDFSNNTIALNVNGTSQRTLVSNSPIDSGSYSGAINAFGFNASNNLYFSKGGNNNGIFAFSNAVTRTYTLQDASGTLAFTSQIPANPVGGTGAAGRVAYWNGSGTITSDSLFQWNDTFRRLGIGCTPTVSLDVVGAGVFTTSLTSQQSNISADGAGVVLQGYVDNNLRIAVRGSGYNSGARGGLLASTGDFSNSVTAVNAVLGNTSNNTNAIQFLDAASSKGHIGSGFGATFINNNSFFNGSAYVFDDNTKPNSQVTLSAGTIVLSTGAANVDPTAKVTILNGGNVGIGVTPSAWDSSIFRGLQIGTSNPAFFVGRTDAVSQMQIGVNAYFDGTWKHFATNAASRYYQAGGEHYWDSAVSASANSTVAWVERMRITSGGNVLIGTTTDNGTRLQLFTTSTAANVLGISNGTQNLNLGVNNSAGSFIFESSNNALRFGTNDTERMRITSGGNVGIGTNNPNGGRLHIADSGADNTGLYINNNTFGHFFTKFAYQGSVVGSISYNGSNTVYTTTSDYRLKQDIKDFNGLDLLSRIKTYDFEWKSDKTRSYGVLAHELQEVINYAVTGSKDAEEMQGVDYSKIVPILIKAIQEQQKQIQELKKS